MIRIQNIYYMLSYAFQVLQQKGYQNCAVEEFDHTAELLCEILIKGITIQLKKGIRREYFPREEECTAIRGKINLTESMKIKAVMKQQMICRYDEFSMNTYENQVIKATCQLLLRADVSKKRKRVLRKLMVYFQDVSNLKVQTIQWNFSYQRHNKTEQMLFSICYLIVKGLLQTERDGTVRLKRFFDEQQMHRLYEKFIFEYYKKEMPMIATTSARIPWQLDNDYDQLLPRMQSDILLEYKGKILIIDAKYYEHTLQIQEKYRSQTIHSANLYQIFSYVKNKDVWHNGMVAGLLLYAKTDETEPFEYEYQMSGNQIAVKTLDLNVPFQEIAKQLDEIVKQYFQLEC